MFAFYPIVFAMIANLAAYLYLMITWADGINIILLGLGFLGANLGLTIVFTLVSNMGVERPVQEKRAQRWQSDTEAFFRGHQHLLNGHHGPIATCLRCQTMLDSLLPEYPRKEQG